jgi:hypothetical protein
MVCFEVKPVGSVTVSRRFGVRRAPAEAPAGAPAAATPRSGGQELMSEMIVMPAACV